MDEGLPSPENFISKLYRSLSIVRHYQMPQRLCHLDPLGESKPGLSHRKGDTFLGNYVK